MFTDPNKKRATDPGNPDGCVVYSFHKIYNPACEKRREECKAGSIGCVACKKNLFELMEGELKGFSERRKFYSSDRAQIRKIMESGGAEANASANATLEKVKTAMRLK